MKKKYVYLLRGISVILFLALLLATLGLISNTLIMKRTDGITTMKGLYAQPKDSIDLLVLGSSHAGMNTDAGILWSEYGISSYMLWGSIQPFWNSYHFLVEALKTQTPKVVLLETYAATFSFEYSDDARQITNVCGMKWSKNKWEAIKVTTPEENWENFAVGLPLWHTRYNELTENDFAYYPWSERLDLEKGTGIKTGSGNVTLENVEHMTQTTPLAPKQEEYLRKIIELCAEKQIPIVLYNSVTVPRAAEQPFYNEAARIAAEYDCPYLNLNTMDSTLGIVREDIWTDNSHLNSSGAYKISRYLAEFLKANYDLPDHRGDETYASWQEFADRCAAQYAET